MFARKRKWISLGRASKLLGCHYTTLTRYLDKPEGCGFTVHEETGASGKRLRYLALDEILQAMGKESIS